MSRLISLLKSRLFISGTGVIALALLIWFGADFIRFGAEGRILGTGARLSLIALLFAGWGVYHLVRYLLERRRNQAMLQDMQADQGASAEDQRSQEEEKLLQQRFSEALQQLRRSRFRGQSGSRSLYQLPWYIIIGPPGAGKTTALLNSGLDFPLAESHGKGALGGIGGTRNCDWWFTNEAVLIDTAGRYTTQDSHRVIDSGAWQNFIQLLKKYRRRQPVNGVIVAISVQDLLMQTAEQRAQQAKIIRTRLDELQEQLGLRFPIYLMFTKCDLVAGFTEFFANLSAAEREQVWGMTFPVDTAGGDALAEQFAREYDLLLQRLGSRTLWRMHQERDHGQRALISGFPLQMGNLKNIVGDFLRQAFASSRYHQQPLLRGVYFSSGTQEGTPIDRMMTAVTANFRLGREVARPRTGSGKSFFLSRLLRDVIFAEAELAGTNRRAEQFLLWGRRAGFAGLGALVLVALVVWTGAVARNNQHMAQVRSEVAEYRQAREQLADWQREPQAALPALDPLRRATEVYRQDNRPWLSGLGLYDPRVDRAANALYRDALGRELLPRLQALLETRLGQLDARDAELLPTLRVYLMLGHPQRRDTDAIHTWAAAHWQQALPGQAGQQQQLLAHLDTLLASDFPGAELDDQVVARAQRQLRETPVPQRVYARLKSTGNLRPVNLYEAIGGNTRLVFGIGPDDPRLSTPWLFTRDAYRQLDLSGRSPLLRQTTEERWLLGDQQDEDFSEADLERIASQVRQLYLAEYVEFWRSFLNNLEIRGFDSLDQAVQTTRQLADPVYSPLVGVLRVVAEQTRLTPAAVMDASAATRQEPTPVDRAFRDLQRAVEDGDQPAPVTEVINALRGLHGSLSEIGGGPNPAEAAFNLARGRFTGAGGDPLRTLNTLAATQPEPLNNWLQQTSRHSWRVLLAESRRHIDTRWRQQVYSACQRSLEGRFPLVPDASAEVGIEDFTAFFKPGGIEANFSRDLLEGFIDRQNWRPRQIDGQSIGLSQQSLAMLQRGQQVRSAFFGSGGDSIAVAFSLRPERLDSAVRRFELDLGPRQPPVSYTHGPKIARNLEWRPGEDRRARILFEDLNDTVHRAQYEGDWALLRLLNASEVSTTGRGNVFQLRIGAGGRSAEYELTARSTSNPFAPGLISGYRCLQQL